MLFKTAITVPPGAYVARFTSCIPTNHPEYGKGVVFKFDILKGKFAGQIVGVTCNSENPPTAGNKLGKILAGLLGRPFRPHESVDPDAFIGGIYHIVTTQNAAGTGTFVATVVPQQPPDEPTEADETPFPI
jgi:hypothetical protein